MEAFGNNMMQQIHVEVVYLNMTVSYMSVYYINQADLF